MKADLGRGHVLIEKIRPDIDCGRYRAKAVVGDAVEVSADVFTEGPALLQAVLRFKGPSGRWGEVPMTHLGNDRYSGSFRVDRTGMWRYAIEAWVDHFSTWRRGLERKADAGQNVSLELEEGARMIEARLGAMSKKHRDLAERVIQDLRAETGPLGAEKDPRVEAALDSRIHEVMLTNADRSGATITARPLELSVERERARFGAWYEFFPRSTGAPGEHGTFKTAADHLKTVADMGFDVVYLPPIHPIGRAYRKGKNNTLQATKDDVGSPWAIGGLEGGHDAVHPDLGTMDDFDAFVKEADRLGIEVALDFAIQCSPDHPWVKEHPEWFHIRPDGSIQYAENPPKKYQDVYPVNFDTDDQENLWLELKRVVDHWIAHGVKIFRVDNPHTKPFAFWEWLIREVRKEHPEVFFLSEAFTRPKVMNALAKLGFTQSYTYFTWRNHRWEIEEYLREITQTEMADFFWPNFFTNTQDILHEYLQRGGPPAFKVRLVLAAFLSPTYGIYSGFEFFENVPLHEGSEEYLNSEKYELKHREWRADKDLIPYVTMINEIRRKHPALSELRNLSFHNPDKENLMAFSKASAGHDPILVIVNLNPHGVEEGMVQLDLHALGLNDTEAFEVHDLVTGHTYVWHGGVNYVRLDPNNEPAHIFRVRG